MLDDRYISRLNLKYFLNVLYNILNYGLERLGEDIGTSLREEIIKDENYDIIIKGWELYFDYDTTLFSKGEHPKNDYAVIRYMTQGLPSVLNSLKGFVVSLDVGIIDKRNYKVGGTEYHKAEKRFDRMK